MTVYVDRLAAHLAAKRDHAHRSRVRSALPHREATARRLVGAARPNRRPPDPNLQQTEREESEVPCKLPLAGVPAQLPQLRNDLRFAVTDLPTGADAPIREVLREGDLHVTSIAVDHDDVPAVAFRVEHAGHAVVVSGDLALKNDNLARLATGADLLVYDTAVVDPPGSPKKLYGLHTAPHRIGEIAAKGKVRSLLLSHIPPTVEKSRDEVLESVHATFRGETRFAEDCLRIDLTK